MEIGEIAGRNGPTLQRRLWLRFFYSSSFTNREESLSIVFNFSHNLPQFQESAWASPLWLALPYLHFRAFVSFLDILFYAVSEKGWEQGEIAERNGPTYKDDFGYDSDSFTRHALC